MPWSVDAAGGSRQHAWLQLFPPDRPSALEPLSEDNREHARAAACLILERHRAYRAEFQELTAKARQSFENRAWTQGALDASRRIQLYRDAVHNTWRDIRRAHAGRAEAHDFWMGARHVFLEQVFDDYDADVALTFFYSVMRLAFDARNVPVEYADDGLAERSHVGSPEPVCRSYDVAGGRLPEAIGEILGHAGFRAPFEDAGRDRERVAARLLRDWRRQQGGDPPCCLQMLNAVFFRDREAYLAGKMRGPGIELPVVLALRHEAAGITVDAVLTGKEDMRNILFVSTRSTFQVDTQAYREVLAFLDTLAPERGHPAMCAVLGFTHPARVALNQRLRRHLEASGERFTHAPGRTGMAMIVFSPPGFPYVYKVVRDFSSKPGWTGRARIMDLYRRVHEMNRGRLMLDAWLYRNLHFARETFEAEVLEELLRGAPGSVRLDGDTVVLKHVYAQRRVQPLSTFFEVTGDRALRERAIDGLGNFIRELAGMGLFIGDCYGLPSNTGLTHAFNVALFDFDDLAPILRYRFRVTPPLADERDELLWNSEQDGAWFQVDENDVLVDEWERFLGVPLDLKDYFRQKHGELFTLEHWAAVQGRIMAGRLHFVLPYPAERRLAEE